MSFRVLKVQTFVVACTLSIAMLLFAAQRHEKPAPQFRAIVDLTGTSAPSNAGWQSTTIVSPAQLGGAWTVESLPPVRLVAPVAIIRAEHKNFPDSESLVTMDDVASFERINGAVPQGAIVMMTSAQAGVTPMLSSDALHFLAEARSIVALGSAGTQTVASGENGYLAKKGMYELENVANLSLLPASGVIAVAAPQKLPGAKEAPVRLMAMVK